MKLELTYSEAQNHMFHESAELGRWSIFPKGRRLGATRGGAHAFTEWMLEGWPLLWGDTINANIERYVERYFKPIFKENGLREGKHWRWRSRDKILSVGDGFTDFRSSDNPENWEGFGYKIIFLNEAGIILDDDYLYTNAVLPMMMDFSDSRLIAAGTPKLSQNKGLLFHQLWEKVLAGESGYHGRQFSSYDNPWLTPSDIDALKDEIAPAEVDQEIYGKFLSAANMGSFFKRVWFGEPLDELPTRILRSFRGWDFAATEPSEMNPNPDWTVGTRIDELIDGRKITSDCVYDRKGPGGVDAILQRTSIADGPNVVQVIPIDPGAAGKTAAYHFENGPLKNSPVVTYGQTKSQGSKSARATPWSIAVSKGEYGILKGLWNSFFFNQLEPFPNPKVHDDVVDSGSAAHNAMHEPQPFYSSGVVTNEKGITL